MSATHERRPRLDPSEVRVELCVESDAEEIAAALYAAFPEEWWAQREPPALRPPLQSTRQTRLATRLRPSLSHPNMYWVKATHVPTSRIAGLAGWMAPGHPIHNVWRRSATDFFHWADKHNWSQQDVDDMWAGVDVDYWDGRCRADDEIRRQVMGDEPHWYLAPLLTLPEFQGRGIGSLLLKWAMDQADATDPVTPLYLEASAMGRPVYLHHGFVPVGEHNMVRRGPKKQDGGMERKETEGKGDHVEIATKEVEEAAA